MEYGTGIVFRSLVLDLKMNLKALIYWFMVENNELNQDVTL